MWETYELTTGDITVNAVYTEIEIPLDPPTSEPDEPTSSEEPDEPADSSTSEPETSEPKTENAGGCGSVIGGVSAALAMVAAAAVVLKKKED